MENKLQVKPVVKKFIAKQYPVEPFFVTRTTPYGMFIFNCLMKPGKKHQVVEDGLNPKIYNTKITLSLSEDLWRREGWYMTPTDKLDFNKFVEYLIEQAFYIHMDACTQILTYRIYNSILSFREQYGFTEDDYSLKTLEKKYERYRETGDRCG